MLRDSFLIAQPPLGEEGKIPPPRTSAAAKLMIDEILRRGFTGAHQRLGFVFLDIVWKAIWLACSIAVLFLVGAWFGSQLRGIAWEDTGVRAANALVTGILLREFWAANGLAILFSLASVVALSIAAWFLLEAFVRCRMLHAVPGFSPRQAMPYLISRVVKTAMLTVFALALAAIFINGAPILAIILFLSLAFCLTLLETLIRADAVELLGTDLIRVAGLIGILMSFEMMIGVAFGVMLVAGFLNVARLMDAVVMLGVTGISILFLSMLHSYLLLVRFSAVDIMSGANASPAGRSHQ